MAHIRDASDYATNFRKEHIALASRPGRHKLGGAGSAAYQHAASEADIITVELDEYRLSALGRGLSRISF